MHIESHPARFASSNLSSSQTAKLVPAMAQSRPSLTALAVVTAAVVGLTFAAAPARAESEGNGDPFALYMPGQAFSVGPTGHAQAGMDAGPQTFRPLPATREVQAAPAPQGVPGRFVLRTWP